MTAPQPPARPVTYHGASSSDRTWLQARDRWEELDGRHHLARAEASLKARGEWDPARHGPGGTQPLTLAEHLEVLANGEVVARVYRHPYLVHWALEAGATWQQIAEAAGTSEAKARQEYRELAQGQHRLWRDTDHRFGMDDDAYAAAIERAGTGAPAGGLNAAALASLASWIDDKLGNEHADRQTICEDVAGQLRDMAAALRGSSRPAGEMTTGDEDQAAVILSALAEAAAAIRQRAATCTACQEHPAELCDDTADQLRRADAYEALARQMGGGS